VVVEFVIGIVGDVTVEFEVVDLSVALLGVVVFG
jgi:hypothetical protein